MLNPQYASESPVSLAARQAAYREELRGVRGWLLFLCFVLTISAPFSYLVVGCRILEDPLKQHLVPHLIRAAVYIVLAIYSFVAGLRLWQVKPDAPQFAKDYLLASAAAIVVMYAALRLIWNMAANVEWLVTMRILYTGLWYLYLTYSDRVRITYGQA